MCDQCCHPQGDGAPLPVFLNFKIAEVAQIENCELAVTSHRQKSFIVVFSPGMRNSCQKIVPNVLLSGLKMPFFKDIDKFGKYF